MTDPFDLQRFITAQDPVYDKVLAELRNGRKTSHWMWFIFPQVRGLGQSQMAWIFGISGCEEAEAYLLHPVLGARLRECTEIVNGLEGKTASAIFGYPDDLKFRSSMTLFAEVARQEPMFAKAIEKYFGGDKDETTIQKLDHSL
jgi:uncharacterized protein (DUF1810 family)